ncbi:alpha-N-acetylglucosaminidase [Reticulomyxa filosa]|uniref:Alpha-N-acetylglucosaminidase n=1 Tax=Reticulomyxa filosa TaxID=46433 RepID=X6NIB9_RETFI|nr:alpha-N-acetylglucosaminidase [Reticulomyxa filosa]|eukprot:ETO25097.1 alpha-N-acetylglucosaminidase [Reticulomyxa filosa]
MYTCTIWFGFPEEYTETLFLDPTDPVYVELGQKYVSMQMELFSEHFEARHFSNQDSTHTTYPIFYWSDQYNELSPPTDDSTYLRNAALFHYQSMHFLPSHVTTDNVKVVWVMQGWLFVHMQSFWMQDGQRPIRAYLSGLAKGQLLLLDLIAEKQHIAKMTSDFFGHEYIWCFLHNFGGDVGMSGNLHNLLTKLNELNSHDQSDNDNGLLTGIGLAMEGTNQNVILYHALLSTVYVAPPLQLAKYRKWFVQSRYGRDIWQMAAHNISALWEQLISLMYDTSPNYWSVIKPVYVRHPTLQIVPDNIVSLATITDVEQLQSRHRQALLFQNKYKQKHIFFKFNGGFQPLWPDYPFRDLRAVYDQWMKWVQVCLESDSKAMALLSESPTLVYDLIDITRELLGYWFGELYVLYRELWTKHKHNAAPCTQCIAVSSSMLDILDDIDQLLSYCKYQRLDVWINEAINCVLEDNRTTNDEWVRFMEFNAKNLITRWGPNIIADYGSRQWHGLVGGYYKKRWQIFFDRMNTNATTRLSTIEINQKILAFESSWEQKQFISTNSWRKYDQHNNALSNILRVSKKYQSQFIKYFPSFS